MTQGIVYLCSLVFLCSFLLSRALCSASAALFLMDKPNERSLHHKPTPRTGGLAILASLVVGLIVMWALQKMAEPGFTGPLADGSEQTLTMAWITALVVAFCAVSLWDDWVGLSPAKRFVLHFAGALGFAMGAGWVVTTVSLPSIGVMPLGLLALPLTVLAIMWMTNLYNFMDGMDGFAGGMTLVGYSFIAYISWSASHHWLFSLSIMVAMGAAGFLVYNFPPACIFMGDVGSISIGFLTGAVSLIGINEGVWDIWVPILIFSPFIVDATVTLIRRLKKGKKIWRAHREHFYQRLVLAGWGHKKTVLVEYCLMIACGSIALIYLGASEEGRLAILAGWTVLYWILGYGVSLIEKQRENLPRS